MKALAEIQVIPIGVGVSVRKEVTRAHEVIRSSGLTVRLSTAIKIGTRTDKDTSFDEKLFDTDAK